MQTYILKTNQEKTIIISKSGDYQVELIGEGAHADILGAFHVAGNKHLQINLTTIHAARHTSADTQIRVVVDDRAVAEVNGTIIVKKGAQQTNSFLTEKILLISSQAKAHAIPNLEIEADDVSCSHAATVATIDEEQLFYLQSRGISRAAAQKTLSDGFLAPVLDKIRPYER
jgi:Fe-S cluster assembly protein SufD